MLEDCTLPRSHRRASGVLFCQRKFAHMPRSCELFLCRQAGLSYI